MLRQRAPVVAVAVAVAARALAAADLVDSADSAEVAVQVLELELLLVAAAPVAVVARVELSEVRVVVARARHAVGRVRLLDPQARHPVLFQVLLLVPVLLRRLHKIRMRLPMPMHLSARPNICHLRPSTTICQHSSPWERQLLRLEALARAAALAARALGLGLVLVLVLVLLLLDKELLLVLGSHRHPDLLLGLLRVPERRLLLVLRVPERLLHLLLRVQVLERPPCLAFRPFLRSCSTLCHIQTAGPIAEPEETF